MLIEALLYYKAMPALADDYKITGDYDECHLPKVKVNKVIITKAVTNQTIITPAQLTTNLLPNLSS